MSEIILPSASIKLEGGVLVITHAKTGMVTLVAPARLESWAVAQLRRELMPAPPRLEAA